MFLITPGTRYSNIEGLDIRRVKHESL